jgi:peptidoglycan/LPS O-acetylase OafA/YrhL
VIRKDRLTHLDGLRGVAALVVIAHHYCLAFAPTMQPFRARTPHWLFDTPLAIFYNGGFALAIFFVISGFVVANAGAAGKSPLPINLIVRYLRLAIPATVSVLFAMVLLNLFAGWPRALNALLPNFWLQQSYWDGTPGLGYALWHGLYDVFVSGGSKFNNPLWTMRTELIGSFALFTAYAFTRGWGRSVAVIGLCAVAVWQNQGQYLTFGAGALLRELWAADRLPRQGALIALGAGIILGAPLQQSAMRFGFKDAPFFGDLGMVLGLTAIAAGALIVYAVLASPWLREILSARIPAFLGRISFGLYLVHVPLIVTIGAWLYVHLAPVNFVELVLGLIVLLAASLLLAWAMTKWIDDPLVRVLGYGRRASAAAFARLMPGRRKPDSPGPD